MTNRIAKFRQLNASQRRVLLPAFARLVWAQWQLRFASRTWFRQAMIRQREVLQLLAEGKTMKEVASVLFITPRTVAFHKYQMMEDLGVKRNSELIQYAFKHGLVA